MSERAMCLRSRERIILYTGDKSRANRVFQNVPGDAQRGVIISQDALEAVSLPQPLPVLLLEIKPGELLCTPNERAAISPVCQAFNKQMQMVRHETVRNDGKLLVSRSS